MVRDGECKHYTIPEQLICKIIEEDLMFKQFKDLNRAHWTLLIFFFLVINQSSF